MNIIRFTTVNDLREEIFRAPLEQYVLVQLDDREIELDPLCIHRYTEIASEIDSTLTYSYYRERNEDGTLLLHPVNDYQPGSVRDDFDFGPLVLLNAADVLSATEDFTREESDMLDGGWYALRLRITIGKMMAMIPESLYPQVPSIGCIGMSYDTNITENGVSVIAFLDDVSATANVLEQVSVMPVKYIAAGSSSPVGKYIVNPVIHRGRQCLHHASVCTIRRNQRCQPSQTGGHTNGKHHQNSTTDNCFRPRKRKTVTRPFAGHTAQTVYNILHHTQRTHHRAINTS